MTSNNLDAAIATIQQLLEKVEEVEEHVTVADQTAEDATIAIERSNQQIKRNRWTNRFLALLLVGVGVGLWQVQGAIDQIQTNATVACENANESREGIRGPWQLLIQVSVARNENPTPAETKLYSDFSDYIDKLYASHDCSQLDKEYPIPNPPKISQSNAQ